MSRVGKQPIILPDGVEASLNAQEITVKGPKGSLQMRLSPVVDMKLESKEITFTPRNNSRTAKQNWGTMRALVANMVKGVTGGYERKLEIEGVGYRATLSGKTLDFNLGFSHPVKVEAPEGIEFKVEKSVITISGISKEKVGQIASEIRALKKPEPYKGKGIRYQGEVVRRKAGKKASGTS